MLKLYQKIIWKHFGDVSLYSKLFFMATVFDSHGFPHLILFLVLHVFGKQNMSLMQVCLHCLNFLAFRRSWSVLSQFWSPSDIMGKSIKNQHCEKTYESKTLGRLFGYQEVITKWYDVIVSFWFPPRKHFWTYYIHCNIFKCCTNIMSP